MAEAVQSSAIITRPWAVIRTDVRRVLSLEKTAVGIVVVVAALAAVGLAGWALVRGARIDRDVAALSGQLLPATAEDVYLIGGIGVALVLERYWRGGSSLTHMFAKPRISPSLRPERRSPRK